MYRQMVNGDHYTLMILTWRGSRPFWRVYQWLRD